MKTVAAILAGGSGKRFGTELPKQFVSVSGKMIIEYTVDAFEENESIDEICIVVNSDYIGLMKETAVKRGWKKIKAVLSGGKERYDSSLRAIKFYSGQDINILIHDAARPKISQRIITEAANSLLEYDAVCTAVSATDTIAVSDAEMLTIKEIPPRKYMFQVQTPQGFKLSVIEKAYESAMADSKFTATDDCGVLKRYMPDIPIKIIPGSFENIKITRTEDLKQL